LNQKQRLQIHEKVFSKLYTARLAFNDTKVIAILRLIDNWCFSDNGNNGELSEFEVQKQKDYILKQLEEL